MPLHVTVVTQEGQLFDDQAADAVVVPAGEGEMVVLPHHAPLIATLGFGELRVRKQGAEESFAVYGGVVEVRPDRVVVLADIAESTYDLDEAKAREAREGAERLMKEGLPAEKANTVLQELRRASIQENLVRKIRNRPGVQRIKIIEDTPDKKK